MIGRCLCCHHFLSHVFLTYRVWPLGCSLQVWCHPIRRTALIWMYCWPIRTHNVCTGAVAVNILHLNSDVSLSDLYFECLRCQRQLNVRSEREAAEPTSATQYLGKDFGRFSTYCTLATFLQVLVTVFG